MTAASVRSRDTRGRVDTVPLLLSRVNLYPYRELRDEESTRTTSGILAALADEASLRERIGPELGDQLYEIASRVSDEDRRKFVLPLRRDIFNRRPPSPDLTEHYLADPLPGLEVWRQSWEHTNELTARLDQIHESVVSREREHLVAWAGDSDVGRALAVSSPALLHAIERRAKTPTGDCGRRIRKEEPTLVQYFSRSTVRVSPFSLYTGVHIGSLAESATSDPAATWSVRSSASVRRVLVRQAGRRLADDPRDAAELRWRVTRRKQFEGETTLRIHRRTWVAPERDMKVDALTEDIVRVPLTPSLRHAVQLLENLCPSRSAGMRLAELSDGIAAATGWATPALTGLLGSLIECGLLEVVPPADEQDDDYEAQWLEYLHGMTGEQSTRLAAALHETTRLVKSFGEVAAQDRVRAIGQVTERWSAAIGAQVAGPIVEDATVSRGVTVDSGRLERWTRDLERALPLLVACDDQRLLDMVLESHFVDQFGEGGRCTDLARLAEVANASYSQAGAILAGDVPKARTERWELFLEARERALAALIDAAHSGEEAAELPDLGDVADLLRRGGHAFEGGVTVFGQPSTDLLFVNHLYGGKARYFTRYLPHSPAPVTEILRNHVRATDRSHGRTAQMRPALGFNANLGPLLAEQEVVLDETVRTSAGGVDISDVVVEHTPGGLRVVTRNGEPLDLLYAGFLVPHALPSDEAALAAVTGSPYYTFSRRDSALVDARDTNDPVSHRGTSRIRCGDVVLFRRRWPMSAEVIRPVPGESPAAHFRRVNEWRLVRGIPDQVFVRSLRVGAMTVAERAMRPKPQHLDFLSRLHVAHAHRVMSRLGEDLVLEEFSPVPGPEMTSDRGAHAHEIAFELSLSEELTT